MNNKLFTLFFFFFNDTATTEIYTLSLHDALPISRLARHRLQPELPLSARAYGERGLSDDVVRGARRGGAVHRSEEHTSELQSHSDLVCRLLLEKKKNQICQNAAQHTAFCLSTCSI